MQWTSEYIRIWFWPRAEIPLDVSIQSPDPGSWGLPVAELGVGNCTVDEHFQQHKIIFDTTFCGEYAGNPFVWNSADSNSCAARTGFSTCDAYVATNPQAFANAYWEINSVRVYQLADPSGLNTSPAPYIASQQTANTASATISAPTAIATLNLNTLPALSTAELCSRYNFSIISDGNFQYEIACGVNPPGPDITSLPYAGFQTKSLADCIKGCTYYNLNNGTNVCGAVAHDSLIDFCYFKKYIDAPLVVNPRFNEVRLIYYGYPEITDNPSLALQTSSSVFVETIPVPQTYRPLTATSTAVVASTTSVTATSRRTAMGIPALGNSSTPAISASSARDYSQTAPLELSTSGLPRTSRSGSTAFPTLVSTSTLTIFTPTLSRSSATMMTASTDEPRASNSTSASVLDGSFYMIFNAGIEQRLAKRSVQYLAFTISNNQALPDGTSVGYLTEDQSKATVFRLIDGALMTTSGYLVGILNDTNLTFTLTVNQPAIPVSLSINSAGVVTLSSIQGFCEGLDGALLLISDGQTQDPENCTRVTLELVAIPSTGSVIIQPTGQMTILPVEMSTMSMIDESTAAPLETMPSFTDEDTRPTISSPTRTTIPTRTTLPRPAPSVPRPASTSSPRPTQSSPTSTGPFTYAGCFGITGPIAGVIQVGPTNSSGTTNNMTIEYCSALCLDQPSVAYYMAVHDFQCFCGTQRSVYSSLTLYPDSSCNTPCPGNASQSCGGDIEPADTSSSSSSSSGSNININSNDINNNSSNSNNQNPQSAIQPTSSPNRTKRQAVLAFISLYNATNPSIPPSPSSSLSLPAPNSTPTSFPASLVSYNITATYTLTALSTTYIDVCAVCPNGLTTRATTITVPVGCHGTSMHSSLTVPMTTQVKTCRCGGGSSSNPTGTETGAARNTGMDTITVTVPDGSAIAALQSLVATGAGGSMFSSALSLAPSSSAVVSPSPSPSQAQTQSSLPNTPPTKPTSDSKAAAAAAAASNSTTTASPLISSLQSPSNPALIQPYTSSTTTTASTPTLLWRVIWITEMSVLLFLVFGL